MSYNPSQQKYFKLRLQKYDDWVYLNGLSFNAFEKYTIVQDPTCSNWPIIAIYTKKQVEEGKVVVLKSIALYFKDNLPTPGKKTSTGTLKST